MGGEEGEREERGGEAELRFVRYKGENLRGRKSV